VDGNEVILPDMNDRQRNVLLGGLSLMFAMAAFPPWVYTFNAKELHSRKPAGYGFICSPPAPEHRNSPPYGVEPDVGRLLIQWAAVALATTAIYLDLARSDGVIGKLLRHCEEPPVEHYHGYSKR